MEACFFSLNRRFYNLAKPNINLLTAEEDANIST